MTITPLKKGFELSDKLNSIQIFPLQKELLDKEAFIITNTNDEIETNFIKITNSGEYEIQDISVAAYKLVDKVNTDADCFRITIEGINILLLGADVNTVTSDFIEKVGSIHIVILDIDESVLADKKLEIVAEFEPFYTIINGNIKGSELFNEKVNSDSGILKKLKLKADDFDFNAENITTQVVLLK
jgi:hypothetical protein